MNRHYETKVARQCHICMECDQPIEPGSVYHRVTWDEGGYYTHYIRCGNCDPTLLDWLEDNVVPETLDVT